jgi:predicted N-acetyltransferase YhbS
MMILGRLAVDINHQSAGIGKGLVRDAIIRTLQASEIAGIGAILVHAIVDRAKQFYEGSCGFSASLIDPLTLMITLADARKILED